MNPPLSDGLPLEELQLARLVCVKLAGLLKGTLSVGMTVCLTEVVAAPHFLSERHDGLRAHLVVLRCLGLKPSFGHLLRRLREPIEQLLELETRFYQSFLVLARWTRLPRAAVSQEAAALANSYAAMHQLLQGFAEGIGTPASLVQEPGFGQEMVQQFLRRIEDAQRPDPKEPSNSLA
jgi:hypothetical protein